MLRCETCDEPIEEERQKAELSRTGQLPKTCLKHAPASKIVGFMVYGHKTAGEVVKLDNPTPEQKRQMERAYHRKR